MKKKQLSPRSEKHYPVTFALEKYLLKVDNTPNSQVQETLLNLIWEKVHSFIIGKLPHTLKL